MRKLEPRRDTLETLEEIRKKQPLALKEFRKKNPNIEIRGIGYSLKVDIDMDKDFIFDNTALQRIKAILHSNLQSDTKDYYMKGKIVSQVKRTIIKLIKEKHIKLKGE